MARKKTIMKSQILDTAYEVVKSEGFDGFTARNIAKKMDCSTQPIYLEFKNMEDLKQALFAKVKEYIVEIVYAEERTGDRILDICLNYVHFANAEPIFYKTLFLEDRFGAEPMYQISLDSLLEAFNANEKTKNLSKKEKIHLFANIWIVVQGTAALLSQGILKFDEKEITKNLKQNLASQLANH